MFQPFETCYEVWKEAKECYTNDIQRFYTVVSSMMNLKQHDSPMEQYIGQVRSLMQEFNALMPVTTNADE